jgi:hypothetical protein
MVEIKNIFPTPIIEHQVDKALADKIETLIIPKLKHLDYNLYPPTDFNQKKIISPEEIFELLDIIYNMSSKYWEITGYQPSTNLDYWIQDYKPKDFHEVHNHGLISLSGVYWVRANQDAGDFTFINPNPAINLNPENIQKKTNYTNRLLHIKPEKGKLVLFPSSIFHNVLPGGSNCIRTTLAFNFKL